MYAFTNETIQELEWLVKEHQKGSVRFIMSNLGEAYLLDSLKLLQEKRFKYISLDEEDYQDGLKIINKIDVLIVPEYKVSSMLFFPAKKDGYKVYLNDEDSQKKIAQYLKSVSYWNKKNFFRDIVILLSCLLPFGITIYFWMLTFQLY